jgi:hypothetical protein
MYTPPELSTTTRYHTLVSDDVLLGELGLGRLCLLEVLSIRVRAVLLERRAGVRNVDPGSPEVGVV